MVVHLDNVDYGDSTLHICDVQPVVGNGVTFNKSAYPLITEFLGTYILNTTIDHKESFVLPQVTQDNTNVYFGKPTTVPPPPPSPTTETATLVGVGDSNTQQFLFNAFQTADVSDGYVVIEPDLATAQDSFSIRVKKSTATYAPPRAYPFRYLHRSCVFDEGNYPEFATQVAPAYYPVTPGMVCQVPTSINSEYPDTDIMMCRDETSFGDLTTTHTSGQFHRIPSPVSGFTYLLEWAANSSSVGKFVTFYTGYDSVSSISDPPVGSVWINPRLGFSNNMKCKINSTQWVSIQYDGIPITKYIKTLTYSVAVDKLTLLKNAIEAETSNTLDFGNTPLYAFDSQYLMLQAIIANGKSVESTSRLFSVLNFIFASLEKVEFDYLDVTQQVYMYNRPSDIDFDLLTSVNELLGLSIYAEEALTTLNNTPDVFSYNNVIPDVCDGSLAMYLHEQLHLKGLVGDIDLMRMLQSFGRDKLHNFSVSTSSNSLYAVLIGR